MVVAKLRNYFVTGLVILLPVVVTFTIFWNIFLKVDSFLGGLITRYTGYEIPGLGFVAMVIVISFVGLFASNLIGRRLISLGEWILVKIPLVNKMYVGVKQIASVLLAKKRTVFQRAVLLEYPRPGVYSVAFVTNEGDGPYPVGDGKKLITLFLPTTPNPTSGFLLILPLEDTVPLNMTVEDAIKLVISGGSVLPKEIAPESTGS